MTESRNNDQMKNEGEGSRSADRRYRENAERHAESGASEPAAKEAEQALESNEGDELREAEAKGKAGPKSR